MGAGWREGNPAIMAGKSMRKAIGIIGMRQWAEIVAGIRREREYKYGAVKSVGEREIEAVMACYDGKTRQQRQKRRNRQLV